MYYLQRQQTCLYLETSESTVYDTTIQRSTNRVLPPMLQNKNRSKLQLKLRQHLEIKLAAAWDSLGSNSAVPSLPVLAPARTLFLLADALTFKSCLFQRFMTRPNGCRESYRGVNRFVSAPLKLADNVACGHCCSQRQVIEPKTHLFFNSQHVVMSPVARKRIVQLPIGTRAL